MTAAPMPINGFQGEAESPRFSSKRFVLFDFGRKEGGIGGWRIRLWRVDDGWFSGTWHEFRGKAGVQACLMGGYSIARLRGDGRKGNAQPKISWRSPPIAPGRAELRVRPVSSIGADNKFKAFTLANSLK